MYLVSFFFLSRQLIRKENFYIEQMQIFMNRNLIYYLELNSKCVLIYILAENIILPYILHFFVAKKRFKMSSQTYEYTTYPKETKEVYERQKCI